MSYVSRVSCVLSLHVSLQSVIRSACPACSPLQCSLCPGMALPLSPSSYQVAGLHLEQCDPTSAADVEPGTAAVIFQIKHRPVGTTWAGCRRSRTSKTPRQRKSRTASTCRRRSATKYRPARTRRPVPKRGVSRTKGAKETSPWQSTRSRVVVSGDSSQMRCGRVLCVMCVGSVSVPGACLNVVPAMRVQSCRLPHCP